MAFLSAVSENPLLFIIPVVILHLAPIRASAQQSFTQNFFSHNYAMSKLQPAWPTPLVEPDPRLTQYYRFAFSSQYTASRTRTANYGNSRGGGIIAFNRIQLDWLPPSYIQHNSAAQDGLGDTALAMKFRIASASAGHGDYILSGILNHTFASSSHNGALTDTWNPTLAGGIGVGRRISFESSLGGSLPTGKIATQGRCMLWNALAFYHITKPIFLDLENNASYYFAGSHNGKMQNFITPALFYLNKRPGWKPTHPFLVFDGGMQIATSSFHSYNHNTIAEMRILF